MDDLLVEGTEDEALRVFGVEAVELAVEQGQAQVPAFFEDLQLTFARVQGTREAFRATVVEGDAVESVGAFIDAPDEEVVRADVANENAFLLLENHGRFAAFKVCQDVPGIVVPVRQHAVVEDDHQQRQPRRGDQNRQQQSHETDAVRFDGEDLVVRGEPPEGHEDRHEDRHRHGQGDDPGHVVDEQLGRQAEAQTLAQDLIHHLQDDVEDEDEEDERQAEQERIGVLSQHVSRECGQVISQGNGRSRPCVGEVSDLCG